jgi:AmmeMemoRadiSam system protein A
MTSDADRRLLLRVARAAVEARVNSSPAPSWPEAAAGARADGVFVTLRRRGELRGCIGHIEADQPVAPIIGRCAVAACSADTRFPPVTAQELPEIDIELSLLGPLDPVSDIGDIEIGRHGLVVEQGWSRGLLLPQVATEWQWDRETFLRHTCRKAGLPQDAWKHGAKLWRFEAEVFGERADVGRGT